MSSILKRFKSKKILFLLLLSYLGTAMASVLLVSALSTYIIQKNMYEDLNSINDLALSNIATLSSNLFQSSKRTAYEVYQDTHVKNIFLYKNTNEGKIYQYYASDYIHKLITKDPSVFSVILCDDTSIVFQLSKKPILSEDYENISGILKERRMLEPIPRQIKTQKGDVYHVYSIVYDGFGKIEGNVDSVIINIDAEILHTQIYTKFLDSDKEIFITSRDGTILMHSDMDRFSENISDEPYFQNAILSGNDSGHYIANEDNESIVYSYVFDSSSNYIIFSASNYHTFFGKITQTQRQTALISLGILFMIILLSVITSKRLYTPINNIFFNIRSMFRAEDTGTDSKDEKYLSHLFKDMVVKLNNLQKDNMDNFTIARQNFIINLFTFKISYTGKCLQENLLKYKIMDDFDHDYCIIVIRINDYKNFIKNNTREAIIFQLGSIGNIACESLKEMFSCIHCQIDEQHIVLIANLKEKKKSLVPDDKVLESLTQLKENIYKLLKIRVTIGISDITDDIEEICKKYEEAYYYTNYRLVYGNDLILCSDIVDKNNAKPENVTSLIESALNSVRQNSPDMFSKNLMTLYSSIKNCRYSTIVKILFQLADSILHIPFHLHPKNGTVPEHNIEELYEKIRELEDKDDYIEWFMGLYHKTVEAIQCMKNIKYRDLIEEVIRYIHENYDDKNLSANLMADRLSISPQYFSTIFNEYVGNSFPDYVNCVRLEKAKELMSTNPKLTVNDICDKVGFNNRTYFTTAFTKKYGISPGKYKNYLNN